MTMRLTPTSDEFKLTLTPKGMCWLHTPSGRVLPVVSGGDGPNDPPADPSGGEGGDPAGSGEGGDERTFTQADVDKIAARARAEAKKAAAKELQDELGISPSEARAVVEAQRKAEDGLKSEAEKAAEEAKRLKSEAEAELAKAKRQTFESTLERKLSKAGVPEKALARAIRLVDLDLDADDDAIAAEIDTLKDEVPGLFETPDTDAAKPGKSRSPSGVTSGGQPPKGGQATKTALDKGAERWAKKHPRKSENPAA